MSSRRGWPWETSWPHVAEGEDMSEFVTGVLVGAVGMAGILALGLWLMKQ